ncbi:protein translocase SEC61 complex subunit gamma [Candidatus Woesearchaeota archaeon]|nr:protein translocase SEC61 complex subunit gamma [Candidatus Woesearchaeota archaeon]MBT3438552.1 protein translocase SEC61 complex subunit gamma [Candidatus Woesearchaeota archaeon]MBT4058325.1 protein translocase SEC61 complex subunit gamma [Candidatus Woesearchaeota archaeon]MBT4208049.1 protein translocase SEC61 complex subunit gamma [Candidatus Woesearchaeota archaeon]MBT4732029.1 protein translocase SEC61 complex subunit gamma [Candidatus Woesearchaeota archaeon]
MVASKIKSFFKECIRVFKVTKKPSMEEFKVIVKVSGIGMLIIGLIGFFIQIGWQMFS